MGKLRSKIWAFSPSVILVCLYVGALWAQTEDWERSAEAQGWERKVKAKRAELTEKNGDGTDEHLKTKLLALRQADQGVRMRLLSLPNDKQSHLIPELQRTDSTLTEQLKAIVARKGWPTIAIVGIEASRAAALILIHSADHDFQRRLLPELQKLVVAQKIEGSDVATLVDKVLVAEGKPQRFGTQFSSKGNKMMLNPVEDPQHLEQRRELYLLPPMSLYKKMIASTYHAEVE